MRRSGERPLLNPVVDTLGLARGLFEGGGNSLAALAARLGLPAQTAHRALGDALTTAHLFLRLARRWEEERDTGSLAELAAASQDELRRTARR
jgi:DNA polymerase-3 subunit epsilon